MAGCADITIWLTVGLIIFLSVAMIFPSFIYGRLGSMDMNLYRLFNNREYFTGYPTSQLCKMPMTTPLPELSGPADATLDSPRDPYHLLGDYMKPALPVAEERLANLTSECAYISDGQRYLEKTGSYGQTTNNYRHKGPDNGSTWLHELSVSFYK